MYMILWYSGYETKWCYIMPASGRHSPILMGVFVRKRGCQTIHGLSGRWFSAPTKQPCCNSPLHVLSRSQPRQPKARPSVRPDYCIMMPVTSLKVGNYSCRMEEDTSFGPRGLLLTDDRDHRVATFVSAETEVGNKQVENCDP
jgi:hypothetical protein